MTGWVFPVRLFHSLLSAGFERRTKRLMNYRALNPRLRHEARGTRRKTSADDRARLIDQRAPLSSTCSPGGLMYRPRPERVRPRLDGGSRPRGLARLESVTPGA